MPSKPKPDNGAPADLVGPLWVAEDGRLSFQLTANAHGDVEIDLWRRLGPERWLQRRPTSWTPRQQDDSPIARRRLDTLQAEIDAPGLGPTYDLLFAQANDGANDGASDSATRHGGFQWVGRQADTPLAELRAFPELGASFYEAVLGPYDDAIEEEREGTAWAMPYSTFRPANAQQVAAHAAYERGPIADLDAWWRRHRRVVAALGSAGQRAWAAGAVADRVGYAFASGYQEALAAALAATTAASAGLTPPLRALCVTELGGNRPADLQTTLQPVEGGVHVRGQKRFSTLGTAAGELWVVGRWLAPSAEAGRLGAVRLAPTDAGVALSPMHVGAFCPEIPHASVEVDAVVPGERVFAGDAWAELVKPFGALEDALVRCAICAQLASHGRDAGWPRATLELLDDAAGALAAFDDPGQVRRERWAALEDACRQADAAIAAADAAFAASADAGALHGPADRWRRDKALLRVAGHRRAARLAATSER